MARSRILVNPENPNGIEVPFTAAEEALADKEEAQAVIDKKEWETQAYARNRKAEYDALNQLEMQFDDKEDGTTTWEDAIKAIKTKWPKDNSGPV
tara:strand:+ start:131 stop:415 length:285 start_codon:yes stop_codon:yes gene_type:complete